MSLTRRSFLIGLPLLVGACTSTRSTNTYVNAYAPVRDEPFPLPAMSLSRIDPELRRQEVHFETDQPEGTIVVDTANKFLYWTLGNDRAIRYGVGVGRQGLAFRGRGYIGRKAEWPSWTPTANMLRTNPEANMPYRNGVPGGPNNPLGARALYLYRNGSDTMFRIHGTNQPRSIGLAMSSGCIRMLNHDVIDLYERVPTGTRVIVVQA
ncbi:L,D-transpeptidase [Pelagibacterium halotolerans]|uniref:L,D-transpeptidase n=1 Tax=Pelagibacterium halotolerans TaxID=531813 RepID=UPI00384E16FC